MRALACSNRMNMVKIAIEGLDEDGNPIGGNDEREVEGEPGEE